MGQLGCGDLRLKLSGFDACADDILTMPFGPEKLLARVISLTRRSRTAPIASTPVITVGRLEIDIVARTVRAGGSELHLTPLDLGLLYSLAATLAECSRARRSLTRSGGRTTEPRALSWTSTSATCRLMVGSRDASPRWLDAAIGFCLRAKPAYAIWPLARPTPGQRGYTTR